MTRLGTLIRRYPQAAALLLAAAMLLRLIVPAGYMPAVDHGRVTLAICSGYAPAKPAMHHGSHGMGHDDQTQTQSPCAFAELALPVLGSVDPLLLLAALAFVALLALRREPAAAPRIPAHLRPPLRAPPVPA